MGSNDKNPLYEYMGQPKFKDSYSHPFTPNTNIKDPTPFYRVQRSTLHMLSVTWFFERGCRHVIHELCAKYGIPQLRIKFDGNSAVFGGMHSIQPLENGTIDTVLTLPPEGGNGIVLAHEFAHHREWLEVNDYERYKRLYTHPFKHTHRFVRLLVNTVQENMELLGFSPNAQPRKHLGQLLEAQRQTNRLLRVMPQFDPWQKETT
jgi:hypothetical protein